MNQYVIDQVVRCRDIPHLPVVVSRLLELLSTPDVDMAKLAETVSQDADLTVNLLRSVNSSYYGLRHKISNVQRAVAALGVREVRKIVMGCAITGSMMKMKARGGEPTRFWRHALFSAVACRWLAQSVKEPQVEEAFLTGLLLHVGALAMPIAIGRDYQSVLSGRWDTMEELARLERAALQLDHAEVSAAMMEAWQLPTVLVEPIRHAFHPAQAPPQFRRQAQILNVASGAADIIGIAQAGDVDRFINDAQPFADRASALLGLGWKDANALLEYIGDEAARTGELFKIDTGELADLDKYMRGIQLEVRPPENQP